MHQFLLDNRDELIARCKMKVARRPQRAATVGQLANGIPMFLAQLTRTLQAEEEGRVDDSIRLSGAAGGDAAALSEMGTTAAAHGEQLLKLGFSVDQVVHDYGDLCQAITDLAVERDLPVSVDHFRTLNRCLDNAIADAVSQFSIRRDATVKVQQNAEANERLGVLVHELRNLAHSAALALSALESGSLPVGGATGGVLKRSVAGISALLKQSLESVRVTATDADADADADAVAVAVASQPFSLALFIAEAKGIASLDARARQCSLAAPDIDPLLGITGRRDRLMAALVNLLQNAFKFTHPHTEVTLHAYAVDDRVLIDVKDRCGGLPPGLTDQLFEPFSQGGADKSGLGLGLSISRRSVEAEGGTLSVRDVPRFGCVFTIGLQRHVLG